MAHEIDYVQDTFGDLVGKRVARVRRLTAKELEGLMWAGSGATPIVIEFTDNSYIIPMRDEEGNDSGGLCFADHTGLVRS
jgi:hypothetical protein